MHASTRRLTALALTLGLSAPALAQHGRPPLYYEVISVSPKMFTIFSGSDAAEARDINNLGEIVGWARTATGQTHAFKRALLGATVDIGAGDPWHDTTAEAINDNSEVVGYGPGFGGRTRGFYWAPGAPFQGLSAANPAGVEHARDYFAVAINNYGRIVGSTRKADGTGSVAVTWWHRSANPSLFYTAAAGIDTLASDISDSGWFAGAEYTPSNGDDRVFRSYFGAVDYPANPWPSAKDQAINAVNEAGTAVGSAKNSQWENQRAVRWRTTGTPLVLGVLPGGNKSEALDVNDAGFIVGRSTRYVTAASLVLERAFLFHADFGMIELPPPPSSETLVFCTANALNDLKDNGLIQAAGYCTSNGKIQALRWDVFIGEHP